MSASARDDADEPSALSPVLIRLLPEPCALLDAAGVVHAINDAWRDVFFNTGEGLPLADACQALFRWAPEAWPAVAGEIADLTAGLLPRLTFEAMITELPERWCVCSLAALPAGGFVWQLTDVTRWQIAEAESTQLWRQFREAVESLSDGFALFDREDRLVFCNRRFREIYSPITDVLMPGRSFLDIVRTGVQRGLYALVPGQEEAFVARRLASHSDATPVEHQLGNGRWVRALDQPMPGGGIVGIRTDVTDLRRSEELRRQSVEQEATIRAQAALLAELSTPILRITPRALVVPLVGSLDSYRAARVVETLLHAVEEQKAELVILDITGVPIVDTQVANLLIQAARAARLLGTRTVLTGIRPDVAQTIVALGVDLGDIATMADLRAGITYALGARNGKG